jgi:8-oxo-dGTP diphosphatase
MSDVSGKLGHESHGLTEPEFLAQYKKQEYPKPSVTVDLVIFTLLQGVLHVLLIQRKGHPFQGCWALPGGFVDVGDGVQNQGESLEDAAERELGEETSLPRGSCYLEQLHTFGAPGRDPRTRVISVAYMALVKSSLAGFAEAGDDASALRWLPVAEATNLAFDHDVVLSKAVARLRSCIATSDKAFELLPSEFSVKDLQQVFEAVVDHPCDRKNFHRKFKRMVTDGVILSCGKRSARYRPERLYRFIRPSE